MLPKHTELNLILPKKCVSMVHRSIRKNNSQSLKVFIWNTFNHFQKILLITTLQDYFSSENICKISQKYLIIEFSINKQKI